MKLLRYTAFLLLMTITASSAFADRAELKQSYSDKEIVKILKSDGWLAVKVFEDRVIEIKVDGHLHYLNVYEDGDLQMFFGVTGYNVSVAAVNAWNRDHRLSRAYIDSEGDPVIEADLLANAGYSKRQLSEFVKVFVDIVGAFRNFLHENNDVERSDAPDAGEQISS